MPKGRESEELGDLGFCAKRKDALVRIPCHLRLHCKVRKKKKSRKSFDLQDSVAEREGFEPPEV